MLKLLARVLPTWQVNTRSAQRKRRRARAVVRGPPPDVPVDCAGRVPLTRPSSPRADHGGGPGCPLDALPLEIRQQIWEEVIGRGRTFHLVMVERHLAGPECLSPDPSTCRVNCHPWAAREMAAKKHLLPLLLTSRQIYSEAIDYLYSSNTFETHSADALEYLPLLVLPQRINAIRSLVFTWRFELYPPLGRDVIPEDLDMEDDRDVRQATWRTVWHHIAGMQNLQHLHVKLNVRDALWGSFDSETARVLLEPIRAVTAPKTFIITLPFPPDDTARLRINSWSAEKSWKGVDPWDALPCTIRRVGHRYFHET